MTSQPKVVVTIVNWNGRDNVLECLESLHRSSYENVEIVVVDNGSTDGSVEAIRNTYPGVSVIESGANIGYGPACNIGIGYALKRGADYLFVLNNDLIVAPDAIDELVAMCESDCTIGLAGPVMYLYSQPDVIQQFGGFVDLVRADVKGLYEFQPDWGQLPRCQEVTFIGAGILFLRREVVKTVGGFDPMLFYACEDVDLEIRAQRAGYRMVVVSTAKVWHKAHGSWGGKPSPAVKYHFFRGWMIIGRRYLHGSRFVAFCAHYFITRLLRFVVGCLLRRTFDLTGSAIRGAYDGARTTGLPSSTSYVSLHNSSVFNITEAPSI